MKTLVYILMLALLVSLIPYLADADISALAIRHARQDALNDIKQNIMDIDGRMYSRNRILLGQPYIYRNPSKPIHG